MVLDRKLRKEKIGIYNNKRDEKNIQIFQIDILKKKPQKLQRGGRGAQNGYATNTFFFFPRNLYIQTSNLLILFLYIADLTKDRYPTYKLYSLVQV